MSSTDPLRKRPSRKIQKRRSERHTVTLQIPDYLKDGADAQDDVTAPPKGKDAQYMNQSVFSMIAAAGSKTDFHARFDDSSSDSDEAPDVDSSVGERSRSPAGDGTPPTGDSSSQQQRRRSPMPDFAKALPRLHPRSASRKRAMASLAGIRKQSISPRPDLGRRASSGFKSSQVPVMSRMLEAKAKLQSAERDEPYSEEPLSEEREVEEQQVPSGTTSLAVRLMEIFEFNEPEEVLSGQ